MKEFVIVFDRPTGDILEMVEFNGSDRGRAMAELFDRENKYKHQPSVEVVMLGADSLETLKRTHMRYFKGEIQKRIATLG